MFASQLTLRNVGEIIWTVISPWFWIWAPISILVASFAIWLVVRVARRR